jgi:hypothetical protein
MEGGEEDPNEELFAEPRGLFINNLDRLRQCSGLNVWGQFKGAGGSPSPLALAWRRRGVGCCWPRLERSIHG